MKQIQTNKLTKLLIMIGAYMTISSSYAVVGGTGVNATTQSKTAIPHQMAINMGPGIDDIINIPSGNFLQNYTVGVEQGMDVTQPITKSGETVIDQAPGMMDTYFIDIINKTNKNNYHIQTQYLKADCTVISDYSGSHMAVPGKLFSVVVMAPDPNSNAMVEITPKVQICTTASLDKDYNIGYQFGTVVWNTLPITIIGYMSNGSNLYEATKTIIYAYVQ